MPGLFPTAPLRHTAFRRLWVGGIFSNLGTMVQSVGAGWLMVSMQATPDMVAMVQAAATMPIMLLSIPSGALADMFERRRLLLFAQLLMMCTAIMMTTGVLTGQIGPWTLLGLTFLMGCGTALHTPSWQASVGDVVPRDEIPSAVTLNSMGLNLMRSIGPAIGGMIVASAGSAAAFAFNAVTYLPMILGLIRTPRAKPAHSLPAEDFSRAIMAGLRYAAMSPNLLRIMVRGLVFGISAIAILALLPLVARELLGGGAMTYGALLGAYGVGALGGGLANNALRRRLTAEAIVRLAFGSFALCAIAVGLSRNVVLTALCLLPAGAAWVLALSLFNVAVQLSTPRWVVGRVLALYQTASFGGMTLGAWIWGQTAETWGLTMALIVAGGPAFLGLIFGLRFAMPALQAQDLAPRNNFSAPATALDITPRSGPIRIVLEYQVAPENDDAFLATMTDRRRVKVRDGATHWVLLRDIEAPQIWKESYTYPTWTEYLRSNERPTQADAEISEHLRDLTVGRQKPTVRRMIERHSITALSHLAIKANPEVD